ncbi:MAG: hypothetical protein AAGJ54_11055 [Planctomycetota bacterium]
MSSRDRGTAAAREAGTSVSGEDYIDRYLGKPSKSKRAEDEGGPFDASEAFVSMLDLELANGNRVALPYATLLKIEFDPSSSIRMQFSTDEVLIEGRRLEELYRGIMQHRVRTVAGDGPRSLFDPRADQQQAVITSIRVTPAG